MMKWMDCLLRDGDGGGGDLVVHMDDGTVGEVVWKWKGWRGDGMRARTRDCVVE